MGYSGFAWAFYKDNVQFSSTKDAICCSAHSVLEYLHSLVVSSELKSFFEALELLIIKTATIADKGPPAVNNTIAGSQPFGHSASVRLYCFYGVVVHVKN